jgi:hypothetical protein
MQLKSGLSPPLTDGLAVIRNHVVGSDLSLQHRHISRAARSGEPPGTTRATGLGGGQAV